MLPLNAELAREWWHNHSATGVFSSDEKLDDDDAWDRATPVEDAIDSYGASPETLGELIEFLVATAPSTDRIPYIGTWHLENAYPDLGEEIFSILESTNLTPETKASIREGFVW